MMNRYIVEWRYSPSSSLKSFTPNWELIEVFEYTNNDYFEARDKAWERLNAFIAYNLDKLWISDFAMKFLLFFTNKRNFRYE